MLIEFQLADGRWARPQPEISQLLKLILPHV